MDGFTTMPIAGLGLYIKLWIYINKKVGSFKVKKCQHKTAFRRVLCRNKHKSLYTMILGRPLLRGSNFNGPKTI